MKILISGIGGPTPIGIAKSLRLKYPGDEIELIGVDGSKFAPGLYNNQLFNKTFLVPHSSDERYWDVMEGLIEAEGIEYAFIVPETEVLTWALRQKEKGLPCGALIVDYDVAHVFYDKHKTFKFLEDTGIVPSSIQLTSKTEIDTIGKELDYPFWIRGASGAGAVGAYKIEQPEDLKNWLNINPDINDFLASTFLPGRNYACKLLFLNDNLVRSASGERVDYLLSSAAPSGISGMCARGKLLNRQDLVGISEKAIREIFEHFELPAHGMFTVDFKEDKEQNPKITEINIRHVSFSLAFSLAGANFAADTLESYMNKDFDTQHLMYQFERDYNFIRGIDSELFIIESSHLKDLMIANHLS